MFSTGQVAATRQRLDNAADAAAYSAALWRARVMNYHAYANRAIVAQEVAIAQAVTLVSWATLLRGVHRHGRRAGSSLSAGGAVLPSAPTSPARRRQAHRADRRRGDRRAQRLQADAGHQPGDPARSVDTFGLGAVANEVGARQRPPLLRVRAARGAELRRHHAAATTGEDRARLKSVVDDSLDGSCRGPRGQDLTPAAVCPACVSPTRWSIRRSGSSSCTSVAARVMTPEFDRWEAADTIAVHDWRPRSGFFGFAAATTSSTASGLGRCAGRGRARSSS